MNRERERKKVKRPFFSSPSFPAVFHALPAPRRASRCPTRAMRRALYSCGAHPYAHLALHVNERRGRERAGARKTFFFFLGVRRGWRLSFLRPLATAAAARCAPPPSEAQPPLRALVPAENGAGESGRRAEKGGARATCVVV